MVKRCRCSQVSVSTRAFLADFSEGSDSCVLGCFRLICTPFKAGRFFWGRGFAGSVGVSGLDCASLDCSACCRRVTSLGDRDYHFDVSEDKEAYLPSKYVHVLPFFLFSLLLLFPHARHHAVQEVDFVFF